jgi:hypothetical protein
MIFGSTLSINASIDIGDDYLLVIKNDMHEPAFEEFEQEECKHPTAIHHIEEGD